MLSYNRFWHLWFTLDNRHYSRLFFGSLLTGFGLWGFVALLFIFLLPQFVVPVLISTILIVVPFILVAALVTLFTKLSDFFYYRQNKKLEVLIERLENDLNLEPEELAAYKSELNLYINRRVICPPELLAGERLKLSRTIVKNTIEQPLLLEEESILEIIEQPSNVNRNEIFEASSLLSAANKQLFIKRMAAKNGLIEIAAREMAELMRFFHIIPLNSITIDQDLPVRVENNELAYSRERLRLVVAGELGLPLDQVAPGVYNVVHKFLYNYKTDRLRKILNNNPDLKLIYTQEKIANAQSGLELEQGLFEPEDGNQDDYLKARQDLQSIDLYSFQENFLLQILLGAQDCNPGNTLFVATDTGKTRLYSVDNESIMPDDNYNVTKLIPIRNEESGEEIEIDFKDVFPFRLWLAGLPHAEVPFKRVIVLKMLLALDEERLLAYHQHKKLFSPAAIGAQLERVKLIKALFIAEAKKDKPTLTPRALFLKFVNNHPTYDLLKNNGLSDYNVFCMLGFISEGADLRPLIHPLRKLKIGIQAKKLESSLAEEEAESFSEINLSLRTIINYGFFKDIDHQRKLEKENPLSPLMIQENEEDDYPVYSY